MTPEQRFNKWLRDHLPGEMMRIESFASPGIPDICLLYNGRVLWIECKSKVPLLRNTQYAWMVRAGAQDIFPFVLCDMGKTIKCWRSPNILFKTLKDHLRITDRFCTEIKKDGDELKKFLRLP